MSHMQSFIQENKAKCTQRPIRQSTKEMVGRHVGLSELTSMPKFSDRQLDRSHLSSRKTRITQAATPNNNTTPMGESRTRAGTTQHSQRPGYRNRTIGASHRGVEESESLTKWNAEEYHHESNTSEPASVAGMPRHLPELQQQKQRSTMASNTRYANRKHLAKQPALREEAAFKTTSHTQRRAFVSLEVPAASQHLEYPGKNMSHLTSPNAAHGANINLNSSLTSKAAQGGAKDFNSTFKSAFKTSFLSDDFVELQQKIQSKHNVRQLKFQQQQMVKQRIQARIKQFSLLEEEEQDKIMKLKEKKALKACEDLNEVIVQFNSNRSETQYQKIKEILQNNPQFRQKVDREDFVTSRGAKAGKINKDDQNSLVDKVNASIIFMEDLFESRQQKMLTRPTIKKQVMNKLLNCIARPSFLIDLRNQQRLMDKYLKETIAFDDERTEGSGGMAAEKQAAMLAAQHQKLLARAGRRATFNTKAAPEVQTACQLKKTNRSKGSSQQNHSQRAASQGASTMSTRVNGESIFDRTSDRLTGIISYINQVSRMPGLKEENKEGNVSNDKWGLSDDFGGSFGLATDRETLRDTLYGDSINNTALQSRRGNPQNTTHNSLMVDSQEYSAATSPPPLSPQQLMTARDQRYMNKVKKKKDKEQHEKDRLAKHYEEMKAANGQQTIFELDEATQQQQQQQQQSTTINQADLDFMSGLTSKASGPFHPPFFKLRNNSTKPSANEDQSSLQPDTDANRQKDVLPNFMDAIFVDPTTNTIATAEQYKQLEEILETFYSIKADSVLDGENENYQCMHNAEQSRKNSKQMSLSSVKGCSEQVNKILMSKHHGWLQHMYQNYQHQKHAKEQAKAAAQGDVGKKSAEANRSNIFHRMRKDIHVRRERGEFISEIDDVDFENERTSPRRPIVHRDQSLSLQKYLRQGGKVRDLCERINFSPERALAQFQSNNEAMNELQRKLDKDMRFERVSLMSQQGGWPAIKHLQDLSLRKTQQKFRQDLRLQHQDAESAAEAESQFSAPQRPEPALPGTPEDTFTKKVEKLHQQLWSYYQQYDHLIPKGPENDPNDEDDC